MKRRNVIIAFVASFFAKFGFGKSKVEEGFSDHEKIKGWLLLNGFKSVKFTDKFTFFEKMWVHQNLIVQDPSKYRELPCTKLKVDQHSRGFTVGIERVAAPCSYLVPSRSYILVGVVNKISDLEKIHSFMNGVIF